MSRSSSEESDHAPTHKREPTKAESSNPLKSIEIELQTLDEQIQTHQEEQQHALKKIDEQSRKNLRGSRRRAPYGRDGGGYNRGYRNNDYNNQRGGGYNNDNYRGRRNNNFRNRDNNDRGERGQDNRGRKSRDVGRKQGGTVDQYGRRRDASRSRSQDRYGDGDRRGRFKKPQQKFFGLAQTGKRSSRLDSPTDDYNRDRDDNSEDDEPEVPQMVSLVTMGSDNESDGEEEGEVDEEPKEEKEPKTERENRVLDRKRKYNARNQERKRRRVNIINKMKTDKSHQKRSRRLFDVMRRHLGRAKKESQLKNDIQNQFVSKAKNILEAQKVQIYKDYETKQKEKYQSRKEYAKKKVELLSWTKKHKENLLQVNDLKNQLLERGALIDDGFICTSAQPPIFWKSVPPEKIVEEEDKDEEMKEVDVVKGEEGEKKEKTDEKTDEKGEAMEEGGEENTTEVKKTSAADEEHKKKLEEYEELVSKLKEAAKKNLQQNLDLTIQKIIDVEGDEPEEPEPLPREFQTSPIRTLTPRNQEENKKRFGKNREAFPSRPPRRRSPERERRNISTTSLRNRKDKGTEPEPAKEEPVMMSLISVPDAEE